MASESGQPFYQVLQYQVQQLQPQVQQLQQLLQEAQQVLQQYQSREQLDAECQRLEQQLNRLKEERESCYRTACALALEHLSEQELANFTIEGYLVPFEKVIEELEREHGGRKDA